MDGWIHYDTTNDTTDRGKVATHTALVFFHRFFKHQGYEQHDRLVRV